MATIEPCVCVIPFEELEGVEDIAFETLHMDREMVMEDFDDVYEDTDAKCRECLECKGMYVSYPVEGIEGDRVILEGGATFESAFLADVLTGCDEVVLYAATVHGCEALAKDPNNSPFDSMFYNGWGVGYILSSHRWIKERIAEAASAQGRYVGRGWVPGEGDLEMSLLNVEFELLDPSKIGIELPEGGLMRPIMSVGGIMGVSDDPVIQDVGKDIEGIH